jgi:hypothetical protein
MAAVPVFAGPAGTIKDTLQVRGKAIVFFGPSQAEYVSMSDYEKNEIDEVLYDFYHYRKEVLAFIAINGIQEYSTARSYIKIFFGDNESITYTRAAFDHVVGIIMTEGRHVPQVFLGAATDSDLISMFTEYFDLE